MSCSVHDMADMEARGIPTVFLASTEFVEAADAQQAALGVELPRVFVPHPIQDRTDEEIRTLARNAVEAVVGALTFE